MSAKECLDKEDRDVDTKELQEKLDSKKEKASSSTPSGSPKINAEKILFGSTLGKHHVANIELDSDQESTDGEQENESPGKESKLSFIDCNNLNFNVIMFENGAFRVLTFVEIDSKSFTLSSRQSA